jgi:hypothetical protein
MANRYFPEYAISGTWYRFSQRGQDVSFASESEAQEYLNGVAGQTRVATEKPITEVSQKGHLNGSCQGFSLLKR